MKFLLPIFTAAVVLSGACTPEKETLTPEPTTSEKIAGKWKVQKINIDYYDPIPVLDDSVRYVGLPADSLVFKSGGLLYDYVEDPIPEILPYSVVNSTSMVIDGEKFQIKELTSNKFRLHSDSVNTAANERTVFDVYLFR
jgi:hypothetical protein